VSRPGRYRGSGLRRLPGGIVLIVIAAVALALAKQGGWLDPDRGTFVAIDGDSLRKDGTEYRLMAIDAPELHQRCTDASGKPYDCGREAKEALRQLTSGRALECRITDRDRYGRSVAECFDGTRNINGEMVRLGWALAYRRHGTFFVAQENAARTARRGIWRGPFEEPEAWRSRGRNGRPGDTVKGSLGFEIEPD
jgi:endonuclease YncB( thermonuclease family)